MNEKELLKRIAELPREIPPENDPWQKISARLDERSLSAGDTRPERGPGRFVWQAVAALAVLAVAVTLLKGPEQATERPALSQAPEQQLVNYVAMPYALAGSEAEYQAAFREFIPVGDSRERLPALTVEKLETGWADLRQVETALADALAQNPNDPFLNKRMLELRAKQLGFLRQLAALDHSNRRLTI